MNARKKQRPWERVWPSPEHTGICRGQRAVGLRPSLTCFVGSAQFSNVFIAARGKDLNQAGFISASPLQRTQETTGLLQLPRVLAPRKKSRCHATALPPHPRVQISATEATNKDAPLELLLLSEYSQALLYNPGKVPDNDSDMVMSRDHMDDHLLCTHQETENQRYSDLSKVTQKTVGLKQE